MLLEAVQHPMESLLQEYVVEGLLIHMGSTCSRKSLDHAFKTFPHTSPCTPVTTMLICREMHQQVRDDFNIILPAADVVWVFVDELNLTRIAVVPQAY